MNGPSPECAAMTWMRRKRTLPGAAADVVCRPAVVLADKAYDADWLRRRIEAAGAVPNIPSMVHRRWKPCFSPVFYRARNRIERFFNRIKHIRRIATRYEKHASNFLAMLKLAAAHLWLRRNAPMS